MTSVRMEERYDDPFRLSAFYIHYFMTYETNAQLLNCVVTPPSKGVIGALLDDNKPYLKYRGEGDTLSEIRKKLEAIWVGENDEAECRKKLCAILDGKEFKKKIKEIRDELGFDKKSEKKEEKLTYDHMAKFFADPRRQFFIGLYVALNELKNNSNLDGRKFYNLLREDAFSRLALKINHDELVSDHRSKVNGAKLKSKKELSFYHPPLQTVSHQMSAQLGDRRERYRAGR